MNKVYRVIWNVSKGVWQCVSEFAIAKGKNKSKSQTKQMGVLNKLQKHSRAFLLTPLMISIMLITHEARANLISNDITITNRAVIDPNTGSDKIGTATSGYTGATFIGDDKKITVTIGTGGDFTALYDVQVVSLQKGNSKGSELIVTDGGKLKLQGTTSWLDIGASGYGLMTIKNGGTVVANGYADIGSNSGTEFSKLTVDGATSSLWVNKDLVVGDSNRGYGQLDIKSGGKIDVGSLITSGANAVGEVYVDNGTIQLRDSTKKLFDQFDTTATTKKR